MRMLCDEKFLVRWLFPPFGGLSDGEGARWSIVDGTMFLRHLRGHSFNDRRHTTPLHKFPFPLPSGTNDFMCRRGMFHQLLHGRKRLATA